MVPNLYSAAEAAARVNKTGIFTEKKLYTTYQEDKAIGFALSDLRLV
jgi:hypothetical protein